jgi:hypothetical protein
MERADWLDDFFYPVGNSYWMKKVGMKVDGNSQY